MYGSGVYDEYEYDNYPVLDDPYIYADPNTSTIGDIYKSNSQAVESFFLKENIKSGHTENSNPTYKKILEDPVKFAGNIINNVKNMREKFQSDAFCAERRMYVFMIFVLIFIIVLAYLQNKSLHAMLLKTITRPT